MKIQNIRISEFLIKPKIKSIPLNVEFIPFEALLSWKRNFLRTGSGSLSQNWDKNFKKSAALLIYFINFRHWYWLKIRTYSNLRNCFCLLGTGMDVEAEILAQPKFHYFCIDFGFEKGNLTVSIFQIMTVMILSTLSTPDFIFRFARLSDDVFFVAAIRRCKSGSGKVSLTIQRPSRERWWPRQVDHHYVSAKDFQTGLQQNRWQRLWTTSLACIGRMEPKGKRSRGLSLRW